MDKNLITNKDRENLAKLPKAGRFALGAIGAGFPSATARRLLRLGLLERRVAAAGMSRTYDYRRIG